MPLSRHREPRPNFPAKPPYVAHSLAEIGAELAYRTRTDRAVHFALLLVELAAYGSLQLFGVLRLAAQRPLQRYYGTWRSP